VIARLDRPVVLVGMMGVGRPALAAAWPRNWAWALWMRTRKSSARRRWASPEIFSTYGEAFFRDGERRVIARLLGVAENAAPASPETRLVLPLPPAPPRTTRPDVKVISTGGGAL
jgi:shikimate kinase